MAPWCAKEDVPTSANLNCCGGSGSCVCDGTATTRLFPGGRQGESKLIVSVSVGFSAHFGWKPRPSLDCDAGSTWLDHGDLLVMGGRCQDEYLHSTDPKLNGERVNIAFRWTKNHFPQSCWCWGGVLLARMRWGSFVSVSAGVEWSAWELGGGGRGEEGESFLLVLLRWGCWHWRPSCWWNFADRGSRILAEPLVLGPEPSLLPLSCKGASWDPDWSLGFFGFYVEKVRMPCTLADSPTYPGGSQK